MHRTLTVCRSGLSVAAAVVLLTACGGSDDESSVSSSTSASSGASETAAGGADSEFCDQAGGALSEIVPAFSGGADAAAQATALQDAADRVRTIDPPSELAADWTALADGIESYAQAVAAVDPSDPASQTELQQRSSEIVGSLTTSATNVQDYLAGECGIDVDPTEPAAPTS